MKYVATRIAARNSSSVVCLTMAALLLDASKLRPAPPRTIKYSSGIPRSHYTRDATYPDCSDHAW